MNWGKVFSINTIVGAAVIRVINFKIQQRSWNKHLILFCIFLVSLDFQDGDFEELADAWLTNVNSERSKCFKDQAKANHEMIR